jgi:large subunit ribosomal protein L15
MKLNELSDNKGARKARSRVGRGIGSGTGKTSGRGHKGQKSRSGVSLLGKEGGQMPLYRRLPKRGFHNLFGKRYAEVNLGRLQIAVDAGKLDANKTVDGPALLAAGVVRRLHDGVKLLANGELKAKLNIEVAGASKAAIAAVGKAGGKIVLPEPKAKPDGKKARAKRERESARAKKIAAVNNPASDEKKSSKEAKGKASSDKGGKAKAGGDGKKAADTPKDKSPK